MPHVIWKGCSHKPYEAPDEPLPPEATKLRIPQNRFWTRALFIATPLILPVIASLYLKSYIAGHLVTDKLWIAIGLLTALALSIVHEWLHCLPYPRTATAYIGHPFHTIYGIHDLQFPYQQEKRYYFFTTPLYFRHHPMDCISDLPHLSKGIRIFLLGACYHGSHIAMSRLSSCVLYMETRS